MPRERNIEMVFSTDPRFKPLRGLPPVQTLLCVVCVLILVLNGVSLLRNLDGLNAANSSRAQEDRAHMDEIRMQVVIMSGEQNELLAARGAAFYDHVRRTALLGIGINAAAIAVLVLFYTLILRGFRQRLQAERALQQTN